MGHDIFGQNRDGEMIASLRFSMHDDENSFEVYRLLQSLDYFAGVSGKGEFADLSPTQLRKALGNYNKNKICYPGEKEFEEWQQNEILRFFKDCLKTAQEEDKVQVFFG